MNGDLDQKRRDEMYDKLEPEATAVYLYAGQELYSASAAISLKRIADALDLANRMAEVEISSCPDPDFLVAK